MNRDSQGCKKKKKKKGEEDLKTRNETCEDIISLGTADVLRSQNVLVQPAEC